LDAQGAFRSLVLKRILFLVQYLRLFLITRPPRPFYFLRESSLFWTSSILWKWKFILIRFSLSMIGVELFCLRQLKALSRWGVESKPGWSAAKQSLALSITPTEHHWAENHLTGTTRRKSCLRFFLKFSLSLDTVLQTANASKGEWSYVSVGFRGRALNPDLEHLLWGTNVLSGHPPKDHRLRFGEVDKKWQCYTAQSTRW
jgi:hypothetical protein